MTHLTNNSAFSFVPHNFPFPTPSHGPQHFPISPPNIFLPGMPVPNRPTAPPSWDFLTLDLLQRFTQYTLYRSSLAAAASMSPSTTPSYHPNNPHFPGGPRGVPNPFLAGLQLLQNPIVPVTKSLLLPSPFKSEISPMKLSPISPPVSSPGSNNTSCSSLPSPKHQCDACGRQYTTQAGLGKHRCQSARPGTKAYACQHCDKAYFSLSALKMHIRTHTLPCRCHLCGKAFSRMWLLQGHLRTHTGERPFRCEQCGRAFADRSNLRAHMQTHSAEKKYKCLNCPKSFSRMGLLVKHRSTGCQGNVTSSLNKRPSQSISGMALISTSTALPSS